MDAYIEMTEGGSRTTFTYPAQPFVADQAGIPILTFTPQLITSLGFLGCSQDDSTNGMIGLAITDCADEPITDSQNINITIRQGGTAVTGTSLVDLGSLDSQAAGTFLICNVPENAGSTTTEVSATYNGMALRAHEVRVVKETTTATLLRPGY